MAETDSKWVTMVNPS